MRSIMGSLEHLPDRPHLTSRDREWSSSLTVDVHKAYRKYETEAPPLDHHFISCIVQGSGRFHQERGGRHHESTLRADNVLIMPAGQQAAWWGDMPQNLRFRLPVGHMKAVNEELGYLPNRENELQTVYSVRDSMLSHMAAMLSEELLKKPHPAQRLLVDSACAMLSVHLLRTYTSRGLAATRKPSQLGAYTISLIVSYIEDNVNSAICLSDLASLAGVSRYHFCRIFRDALGMTPMRFVEQTRIRRAQVLLKSRKQSLREIARLVGYTDHSHFSRRFAVHAKCTPSEFLGLQGRCS